MHNVISSQKVTYCIFRDNKADHGGGMYNYNSNPAVTNCILWGDTADEIYGGTPTVNYSNVEGG